MKKNQGAEKNSFSNLRAVLEHLKGRGYRISRATLYDHVRAGKLRPVKNGEFALSSVEKYAASFLKRLDGERPGDDMQRQKLAEEKRKLSAQADCWELRARAESGRWIERAAVELDLAARAALLKADFKNYWRKSAVEIIELVGGDLEKTPELIEAGLAWSEKFLGRYAEKKAWTVKLPAELFPDDISEGSGDDAEND